MKLKENEIMRAEVGHIDESTDEMFMPKTVYFTQGGAKNLRRNSKNLNYWDGCNWKHENIREIEIITFIECEEQPDPCNPAYSSHWHVLIDGKKKKLVSSNMSRHLTPYWEEEKER